MSLKTHLFPLRKHVVSMLGALRMHPKWKNGGWDGWKGRVSTTLGKRISTARERKGISQSRLSELLGVTRGTITRWENDTRTPDEETKREIADALGVSVSYLMGEPQDARLIPVDPASQIRIPLLDMNTTACAGAGNGLDHADFGLCRRLGHGRGQRHAGEHPQLGAHRLSRG